MMELLGRVVTAVMACVAAWTLLSILFGGVGLLAQRLAGGRAREAEDVLLAPWLGWAAALGVLQVWHLFRRMDGAALAALAALAAAGLAWSGRDLLRLAGAAPRRRLAAAAVLGLGVMLWVANQSTTQPENYDSGLYHLSAVRWAGEYPIVRGLGNLHSRLANNNASLLYAALLDGGPFSGKSHHLATGLLATWALAACLLGLARVLRGGRRPADLYLALLVAPLLAWVVNSDGPSSPSPDAVLYLLGVAAGWACLRLLEVREPGVGERAWPLVLFVAAGIAVKLSFIGMGAALGGVAALQVWRFGARGEWRRFAAFAVLAGVFVLVPWMLRGVLLSGYPCYPLAFARVDTDWALPPAALRAETDWVRAWARAPGQPPAEVLGSWNWLVPWFMRLTRVYAWDVVLPVGLAVAGLLTARRSSGAPRAGAGYGLFFLVPLAGIGYCLFTAPNPRFAGSAFWLLAAGSMALALAGRLADVIRPLLLLFTLVIVLRDVQVPDILNLWQRDPGPARAASVVERRTDSGLTVRVPVDGDQCWDAALPCAPYFSPALRLRVPGDLSRGFATGP